ncbi:hypothetical protein FQR65_LT02466 [Abscondita terminalis]|nr:hypothetical protein FQR65_LT02466 [Abscondita terminalis]
MSSTVPLILDEEDCDGAKDVEGGITDDFAYNNNVMQATKRVRMAFIRKVYGLLSVQLFFTVVVSSIFMFTPTIKEFIHTNNWLLIIAMFGSIGLLIALHIKRLETPTNFILLAAFTVVEAYTIGVVVTFYSQAVVLQALLLTLVVVGSLTAYTFQTKRDYSTMYSGLFAGICILLLGGILQLFFHSTVLELVFAVGGALLFSLFIVFDTQMIMQTLSPEEYILATINLYLDIINLFLHILRILQSLNQN